MANNPNFILKYNSDLVLSNLTDFSNLYNYNHSLFTNFAKEINFLTLPKNDPFKLIDILPEHKDTFEIFDAISVNLDNSLYEFLHLPEFKLYYPEPFIASPSFAHEEL